MTDEYIDNTNKVSYSKYEPRNSNTTSNKQEPPKNLLTCYQVEEEGTFETSFVLCEKCMNFNRDRVVVSTRNGIYYKCTVTVFLWITCLMVQPRNI